MRRVLAFLVLAAASGGEPATPIRIRVVTFRGEPVTAARLEVRRSVTDRFDPMWPGATAPTAQASWEATPAAADPVPVATATTDADGWAQFVALPQGAFDVTAHVPGRAVRGAQVLSPPVRGAPPPTILLDAGHAVTGRVVTERGGPLADALVVATFPAAGTARWDDDERPLVVRTDEKGAFRLEGVPEGTAVLHACPPGTWFNRGHLVDVPRDEPVEIAVPLYAANAIVKDERTGAPLPGVPVVFSTFGFHMSTTLARATTDAKGRVQFGFPNRWLGPGEIQAPGYLPALLLASEDNDLDRLGGRALKITAVPAALVHGVVRDPAGPVASAIVTATRLDGFETACTSARSREDGTFDLWVPEGLVHVAAIRPASKAEDDPDLDVLLATGKDGEAGLFEVPATGRSGLHLDVPHAPRAGRVCGRLVTAEGVPAEGRVGVGAGGPDVRTASDGAFELDDVPAGRTRLFGSAFPNRSASLPVHAETGKTTSGVDVLIPGVGAARVQGRVTGLDSHSDGYAVVSYGGRRHPVAADGTFAFPVRVPIGSVTIDVDVVAADGWTAHAEAKAKAGAIVNLGDMALKEPNVRVFRVVAADGGAPICAATATRYRRLTEVACGAFERPVDCRSWRADENGRLRIPIPRDGEWEIQVRADGFSGRDVLAKDIGDHVALNAPAAIAGRVRFGDGRPAAGVRIEVSPPWDSDAAYSDREAVTDAEGRFRIEGLAPIAHYVLVESTAEGLPIAEVRMDAVAAPNAAVEIVVEAARTIEGRVVDARGRPVTGVEVRGEMGDSALTTETDEDGAFRLVGALAGKYDLVASRDGLHVDGRVPGVAAGTKDLVVRAELGLRIAGRVVDGEGRPLAGWVVNANNDLSRGEHRARTDADGRFVIDELEGGSFDLKIGQWAHREPEGGKDVRAGTEDVVLVLR